MDAASEHRDALPSGPVRGRGSGLNPGNRFEGVRLHVIGEHLDERRTENPRGSQVATEVLEDSTKSIINPVDSPDLGFSWTVNPYRGCEHGCIYCYARPTHENLGFSCGLDFETKIMAKRNAPDLLRRELSSDKWRGEPIMISGVTDPYQPVEADLKITRRVLEVCAEFRQPVSLVTKNKLVLRDLDLLNELNRHRAVHAAVSVTTLDRKLAARMEPRASSPADRLHAVRELAQAGIPTYVMTAPIIPGLNDREIPKLLREAAWAGASGAAYVLLRLPHQIKDLFLEWLHRHFPDRAAHVEGLIRQSRDGDLYDARFFKRQRGEGEYAKQIERTFGLFKTRYGLDKKAPALSSDAFLERRRNRGQLSLF